MGDANTNVAQAEMALETAKRQLAEVGKDVSETAKAQLKSRVDDAARHLAAVKENAKQELKNPPIGEPFAGGPPPVIETTLTKLSDAEGGEAGSSGTWFKGASTQDCHTATQAHIKAEHNANAEVENAVRSATRKALHNRSLNKPGSK